MRGAGGDEAISFRQRLLRGARNDTSFLTWESGSYFVYDPKVTVTLDISAENAGELAFHTSFPGGDYPADSSCLSNAVSLSTFAALRLSKLSSFFLLYFLSLQPLACFPIRPILPQGRAATAPSRVCHLQIGRH